MKVANRFAPTRRLTRQRISPAWLLSSLTLVLMLLAGCMPIPPAAAPAAITLRFAIPDEAGRPQIDPYVNEFVAQAHALSQGQITIEPTWDGGSGTPDGYEKGVIQLVKQGKFDLGLASARTWDTQGILNFQVLQAPFLITNDALAEAVATSEIAARLLGSLSPAGVVGLTLWPEDLRHPFSVVPDKPLLAPQDFVGAQIRTPLSDVSYQLMKTLGARATSEDSGYQGAESGLRQGGTLNGKPIATGNVTFFPKYQVLFANAAAFTQLSEAQRTVLRQAAAAAQSKAIAEHPREVDAATAWCADGNTIVLASAEQVAAFEQAAQPIFDQLAQDPLNAELITAIRDLKAHTVASPGATACGTPVAAQPASAPAASAPLTSTASVNLPRIVFSSQRDRNTELYLMYADGSGQTRLTNNLFWDSEPTASRDGKRIAFVSDRDGNDEIYTMNVDGSDVLRLTNDPAKDGMPAFSPDGTQIVFFSERDGNVEIYRMNADGSDQINLSNNPAMDHYPSWSPDGQQILFNSARDGYASLNEVLDPNGEIYVMNVDGSDQIRLTDDGGNNGRPLWSPDGKKIIFDTDRGAPAEIYSMNADGSDQINLTHNDLTLNANPPAWSLDGKQIAFPDDDNGEVEIYVMNADGSNLTRLTHSPGDDVWAAWLPPAGAP